MLNEKKRGIKLSIIDECDYEDYREVCNFLQEKGWTITLSENGNTILERKRQIL